MAIKIGLQIKNNNFGCRTPLTLEKDNIHTYSVGMLHKDFHLNEI